ncbi:hypothetical protein EJB05_41574, partial [Eragrostis curvula]
MLPPSHGPSFSTTLSSGRLVSPAPRRRRSSTRRTVSKVSCRRTSLAESNGQAAVVTIEPPEPISRRALHETKVKMKAKVAVHLKDKNILQNLPVLGSLFHTEWLRLELISAELDPETDQEMKPVSGKTRYLENQADDFIIYEASFNVPASFGPVGAVRVESDHKHDMFIRDIKVFRDGDESSAVLFHCNSWIVNKKNDPTGDKRTFFPLKSYLPSQTPKGLERLRQSELEAIRGDNDRRTRVKTDRIYDYDVYNDLGNPDNDPDTKRPVLGGKERPYPRRCRTGRKLSAADPHSETRAEKAEDIYVPRDEAFSESKEQAFYTKLTLSGLHGLIQRTRASGQVKTSFPSLAAIDALFEEGFGNQPGDGDGSLASRAFSVFKEELLHLFKAELPGLKDEIDKLLKFETPEVHDKDKLAWFRDEEFARETLAGMNPMSIQLVTELPIVSQLDEETYGPRESGITKQLIEQQINGVMTADEVRQTAE